MPPVPGAEPYRCDGDGAGVGVLLCHGFTGSPASLRPWAEYLGKEGLTVDLPLLPGHGTTWQEMATTTSTEWLATVESALLRLHESCHTVFVMGLSMGGALALRLAELHPDKVRGIVVVNPSLALENWLLLVAPALARIVPTTESIGEDIKKPGVGEGSYDKVPTAAAATLPKLWRDTKRDMAAITAPILAYRSPQDHVVGPRSLRILTSRAVNAELRVHSLDNSYHVATLDYDASTIFEGSLAFVREHSRSGEGTKR
ncbi:alpha/beta hydrolase [Streptomonospora nanhaiensis]|uniref:Carboxylesterase n=1 Tax=Streptomonospora nanhaiensis TaxID=1323731 RepID=A0A853BK66_9ACTN|nr:alpha/beta fold hydrolase [Streptomonospora nanhaiensis]MBV2362411.1 alpha/beta fold hydrolase [Streptomonospora nanhaiensis]MBX9389128.1 alpha/beta fold hydrolase [Streptomonospora nanhaiensis]NYI94932.1 carboxylesterase [Streptomonospora nanhaiensis]